MAPITCTAPLHPRAPALQEMSLEEFIFSHPAQIALLGIQFQWTADTQARGRGGGGNEPRQALTRASCT